MKTTTLIMSGATVLFLVISLTGCNKRIKEPGDDQAGLTTSSKEDLRNEAWRMEELYWEHVQNNDTIAYKKLWHDEFIGYPSFDDGTSDKSKIAVWIPVLHEDPNLKFSYKLYKKAVNPIEDVVIVFYDADEMWTDNNNKEVRKVTTKFTHTWKKYGDKWLILGGMAAEKI